MANKRSSKESTDPVRPSSHQPSKAELEKPIYLPGDSPEDIARIIMKGGVSRREPKESKS